MDAKAYAEELSKQKQAQIQPPPQPAGVVKTLTGQQPSDLKQSAKTLVEILRYPERFNYGSK